MRYFALPLNAEPWKSPEGSLGRKGGNVHIQYFKDRGLVAYQHAVKEELATRYPGVAMFEGDLEVSFYIWRDLAQYQGAQGGVTRQRCDATNLQKALEDALQDVLYENDRNNVFVGTWIMAQAQGVEPLILIGIKECAGKPDMGTLVDFAKSQWPQVERVAKERDFVVEEVF